MRSDAGRAAGLRIILPTLGLALAVIALWVVSARAASGALASDWFTLLVTLVIWTALAAFLIAGVVPLVAPMLPRHEQRAIVWLLGACLLAPVIFAMLWLVDAGTPARTEGEIPDVVALLGQSQDTVDRLLGDAVKLSGGDTSATLIALAPETRGQTRPVVYALPDLAASDGSQGGLQQLLQSFSGVSRRGMSDARVTVFYGPDGRVAVANFEFSRNKAREVLGTDWIEKLPQRGGLGSALATATAPAWADSDYTSGGLGVDRWGTASVQDEAIGYHLHAAENAPTAVKSAGVGTVYLTVGEGLLDPSLAPLTVSNAPGSTGGGAQNTDPGPTSQPSVEETGSESYYERTFYVISFGQYDTEAEARERAEVLNERAVAAGETSPAAAVEGVGHLELGYDDSYVVVYTIGYDDQQRAWQQAPRLWWPLRTLTSIKEVTKRCGELTFRAVE